MSQHMQALYQASKELKQLKWGEFIYLDYPILVKNPLNEDIAYCVFMDSAVNVYLGDEGALSYLGLLDTESKLEENYELFKAFYRQNMIRVSYEDRKDIDDEDYQQIKRLDLSFRGKKQWPVFRRFKPGVLPSPICSGEEIELMTIVLEQLKTVLNGIEQKKWRINEEKLIITSIHDNQWKVDYMEIEKVNEEGFLSPYAFKFQNDLMVHRLKKLSKANIILEGIQFFLPEVYLDEETDQLVFPFITAFIDRVTGYVHLNDFSKHGLTNLETISHKLADLMINELNGRPSEIVVEDQALFQMIKDFCEKIEVTCTIGPTAEAINFMEAIYDFTGVGDMEDEGFDDNELDLDDESVLPEIMDTLLEEGNELYQTFVEMPELKKLPKIQQEAVLEVFSYSLVHMAVEFGEVFPFWSKQSFGNFIKTHTIERDLAPKFKKYIYPSMIRLLECTCKLGLIENTDDLIKMVYRHYKK